MLISQTAGSSQRVSFLGAAAYTPNDLTTWTTVNPGKPEVPAGGKITALVTISVPKDAAPGEAIPNPGRVAREIAGMRWALAGSTKA